MSEQEQDAPPADPPAVVELAQIGRRTSREQFKIVQRVEFNRAPTKDEFRAWLEANHWLSYDPQGYGPVSIEVAGTTGIYVHSASTGD